MASSSSFSLAVVTQTFSQTLASSRTFSQTLSHSRRLNQNFPYSCQVPQFLTNSHEISPLFLQIRARSRKISHILAGSPLSLTLSRERTLARSRRTSQVPAGSPGPITRSRNLSRTLALSREPNPMTSPPTHALAIPRTIVN